MVSVLLLSRTRWVGTFLQPSSVGVFCVLFYLPSFFATLVMKKIAIHPMSLYSLNLMRTWVITENVQVPDDNSIQGHQAFSTYWFSKGKFVLIFSSMLIQRSSSALEHQPKSWKSVPSAKNNPLSAFFMQLIILKALVFVWREIRQSWCKLQLGPLIALGHHPGLDLLLLVVVGPR